MVGAQQPAGELRELSPDKIARNPDNPRLFFRSEELDTLTTSIRRYGIQVPITVYEDKGKFVLIDGERRWRCARKLNMKKLPALVQPKPSKLNNLLLMFNIHALREQWDYLTIANKLPVVISLFKSENSGKEPGEQDLSELTGLTRGQIRRCRLLFGLPEVYRKELEEELGRPKHLQRLSEDFFIEMERALKTVQNRVPAAISDMNAARDALIYKFRKKIINNIIDFRKLSKIATSIDRLDVRETKARRAIADILDISKPANIHDIYAQQFESKFDARKVYLNAESIYEFLDAIMESGDAKSLDAELRLTLEKLSNIISRVLGDYDAL